MLLYSHTDSPQGPAIGRVLLLAVLVSGVLASLASADDAQRELALRLANQGRCEPALPELDAARLDAPADPELAFLAGQCRLRLHRYAAAVRDLESAVELAPARPDVTLALAKARYHAGDYTGAERALDRAARDLTEDAEVWLYAGMLELERGELVAAARSLERARSLDEATVEPVASYYLGMAHAQLRDADRASPALQHVSDTWSGTDWSSRAEQELENLRAGRARQVWLAAGVGFEHDSNVVLRGRGTPLPSDISDDDDQRGVWSANGGIELWKSATMTLGTMASYRGTTQVDLHDFEAHFPSVTAWFDLDLAETTRGTARYDFGYAWLDGDPFLATNSWQLSLRRGWPELGSTEVFGRTTLDDYFFESDDVPSTNCPPCGPVGLDERREQRRSGYGLAAGLGHSLPIATGDLPIRDAAVRGGYGYGYFDAEGREYSHQSHAFELGLGALLPFEVDFDASGSFAYRPYRHPTTFPDFPVPPVATPYTLSGKQRRDQVYQVETSLSRSFTERLSASVSWRYTDNQSNADVFDYEQHVLGIQFTVGIGREL